MAADSLHSRQVNAGLDEVTYCRLAQDVTYHLTEVEPRLEDCLPERFSRATACPSSAKLEGKSHADFFWDRLPPSVSRENLCPNDSAG